MISWDEVERLEREATELRRYGNHTSIVLSLIFSLTAVVIISKKHLTNYVWLDVAAFAVPIPVAFYFRNWIVLLGPFGYVAALILFLVAAILFGI
jgi:hypothetical protein